MGKRNQWGLKTGKQWWQSGLAVVRELRHTCREVKFAAGKRNRELNRLLREWEFDFYEEGSRKAAERLAIVRAIKDRYIPRPKPQKPVQTHSKPPEAPKAPKVIRIGSKIGSKARKLKKRLDQTTGSAGTSQPGESH